MNQLTRENNKSAGETYIYTYDSVGNIKSKKVYNYTGNDVSSLTPKQTITYTYGTDSDAGWKKLLTSYNGEAINYDAIGNPTTYRGATLTWDGRELKKLVENGQTIKYTYDADGLRGSKTIGSAKTTYHYVGGQLLYEDRNGTDIYYYYDSNGVISAIRYSLSDGSTKTMFVSTNALGDVIGLYGASGTQLVKYEYDAWGKVISETDADGNALTGTAATFNEINPFRYRGYYYDSETELYYLQSRYYDPEVGRFINSDSLLDTSNVLGFNMFAYSGNNPVNNIDPNGQNFIKNAVKLFADRIVKPIVKGIQKVLSKKNATYSTGLAANGTFGLWNFSGQVGVSADTKGNIAIQANVSGGTTTSSAGFSATVYRTKTNAPSIDELNGSGAQVGGSVIVPLNVPVSIGGELNIIPDKRLNKVYLGDTFNIGLGLGSSPGEVHAEWGETFTVGETFNVFDMAKSIYNRIMEW